MYHQIHYYNEKNEDGSLKQLKWDNLRFEDVEVEIFLSKEPVV